MEFLCERLQYCPWSSQQIKHSHSKESLVLQLSQMVQDKHRNSLVKIAFQVAVITEMGIKYKAMSRNV